MIEWFLLGICVLLSTIWIELSGIRKALENIETKRRYK